MNPDSALDRDFSDWLTEDGPTSAPDRLVQAVLDAVSDVPQARPRNSLLRPRLPVVAELAVAATILVAAVVGLSLLVSSLDRHRVGGTHPPASSTLSPSISPSTSPSAAASSSSSPALPSQPAPTTVALEPGQPMTDGVRYASTTFQPSFTIAGRSGWSLVADTGAASSRAGYLRLDGPSDGMQLQMIRPVLAITEAGSSVTEVPSSIDSWLWSRLDLLIATRTTLFLDRPPSINIDGRIGEDIEGDVRGGAAVNGDGIINVLCSADVPCTWDAADQFAVRPGQHFRIAVLPVDGAPLVIEVSADAQAWDRVDSSLQSLLESLAFPR